MKQEYKEKKKFLKIFGVALTAVFVVGLNSFPVFAEENQSIETTVENFQQEQYDDSIENEEEDNNNNNSENTVDVVETEADSDTIPDKEIVDVVDIERVSMVCTMIDYLPTVGMIYESAPDETEEGYAVWLLETDNILKETGTIQEQYNALSTEEQDMVGEDRKIKLQELCSLATVLSEKLENYVADSLSTDESGL